MLFINIASLAFVANEVVEEDLNVDVEVGMDMVLFGVMHTKSQRLRSVIKENRSSPTVT